MFLLTIRISDSMKALEKGLKETKLDEEVLKWK